jgi:nucleotide-binding universal stress UspA family protein
MKLLLPIDVVHPYLESLKQLERLVPLKEADVFVLYVAESTSVLQSILTSIGKATPHMDNQLKERAREILGEASAHLQPRCHSVIPQVMEGSPAVVIEELALNQQFDLIAIGMTHHGSSPFHLLGRTASHVVKHAPGTILILRESQKVKGDPLNVLIAVDGSPASANALRLAANQLKNLPEQALVTVLNVVSIVGIWKFIAPVEFIASIEDNLNMAAETILAEADKALGEYGITPKAMIIRSGEPANEIIKAAKDINADLIVVGAQGRSAVEQFFLGSVSHKLSLHAPCSTVVVK